MTPSAVALSDVGAVLDRLGAIDPRLAFLALALHVTNHVLRSVAWRNVLAAAYPNRAVPLVPVMSAYASGVALNAVVPARGGDAAKVGLVRAVTPGSSVATIASTMSVLVVFDLVIATVLVLIAGLSGAIPLDVSTPGIAAWVAAHPAVTLGAIVAGGLVARALCHALRGKLVVLAERIRQGGAILRRPVRYARLVAVPQAGAWCCRVGVVLCLLAAFGLPASVTIAVLVMILTGASTIVPLTPGGMGTQQVVLAFALSQTASAAAVVSFSVGMQVGVTAVNALLGVAAAMAFTKTHRPLAGIRSAMRVAARHA